ncbi:MAG TPA: ABC transporter permease [Verrucomicrobiae bacterium]|jgi:ABC-2 type transport system permease protein|nr:ABC transporter permease [Verrucomicrobiae bacterium]
MTAIRAELRKLFSIRSTYILIGLALLYMVFYDFYVVGIKAGHNNGFISPQSPLYLITQVTRAASIAAPVLFSSIIAVLLMAHEYRYNTIMYTLTASNSRNKTLLAKIIAITGFTVIFSLFIEVLAPLLALAGLHLHHVVLPHQVFYYHELFWRVIFFGWAYAMIGLLLAILFRNVVASIVSLFLIPITIEPLLGLILNTNQQQYLPFTALTAVLNNGLLRMGRVGGGQLSAAHSALMVLVYIVIGLAIGWALFSRRDAN